MFEVDLQDINMVILEAELQETRKKLRETESTLHKVQALGKHWVTLVKAPPGKYSGTAVVAACDAFHSAIDP